MLHYGKTKNKKITHLNNSFYGHLNELKWNTYSYSHSSKISIELKYISNINYSTWTNYGIIKIKNFGKNQLKIISKDLRKVDETVIKNQNQYINTSLSPKMYYMKIYKAKIKENYLE